MKALRTLKVHANASFTTGLSVDVPLQKTPSTCLQVTTTSNPKWGDSHYRNLADAFGILPSVRGLGHPGNGGHIARNCTEGGGGYGGYGQNQGGYGDGYVGGDRGGGGRGGHRLNFDSVNSTSRDVTERKSSCTSRSNCHGSRIDTVIN